VVLIVLNRAHSSHQSSNAISFAQDSGINNISIDLMFGLPSLSKAKWEDTLEKAIKHQIQHISCYNLTLEERTSLWHFVNQGKVDLPKETDQEKQFFMAHDILSSHSFNHYEVSNYALDKFKSRHNSNYWNRTNYLGIGPSAHSFNGNVRRWNVANNQHYMQKVNNGEEYFETECLDSNSIINEAIMLGLRTKSGLSKAFISGNDLLSNSEFTTPFQNLLSQNILVETEEFVCLDIENWYLTDHYSSLLFLT